jgi:hypothetical protein
VNEITCNEGKKVSRHLIEGLSINQGGIGRHKCVICAYVYGKKDGETKQLDVRFHHVVPYLQKSHSETYQVL